MSNGGHISAEELLLLAVGAMPEEECAALRAHAAACAECTAKLSEARGHAALLALNAPQEKPAATIKAELFAKIRSEREREETYRWPKKTKEEVDVPAEAGGTTSQADPTSPAPAKSRWWQWVLVPVAAVLVVTTGWEWRENQRLAGELADSNRRVSELDNDRQRAELLVDLLSAPDTVSVKLAAAPEAEKAWGTVRYNAKRGMVMYTAELPPLPADKIYQMWLVPKDGAPISAGVFSPGAQGTRQVWTAAVPANTEVKAFAVTVEPAGGVPQPTGPKVLVGGA